MKILLNMLLAYLLCVQSVLAKTPGETYNRKAQMLKKKTAQARALVYLKDLRHEVEKYNKFRSSKVWLREYTKNSNNEELKRVVNEAAILPRINYKKGVYSVKVGENLLSFTPLSLLKNQVHLNGNPIDISKSDFKNKVHKILVTDFNIFDIFVGKAHAAGILAVLVIVALIALFAVISGGILGNGLSKNDLAKKVLNELADLFDTADDCEDVSDSLESLESAMAKVSIASDHDMDQEQLERIFNYIQGHHLTQSNHRMIYLDNGSGSPECKNVALSIVGDIIDQDTFGEGLFYDSIENFCSSYPRFSNCYDQYESISAKDVKKTIRRALDGELDHKIQGTQK